MEQFYLFLIFILNGIIIGCIFDIFRISRKSFKTKDIITYIEDVLFWIISGIITLYFIFIFNNGEIRLFIFLGILFGISLYMLTISKYFIKISVNIILHIKKLINSIISIIIKPFILIFKMIKKIFFKPISFFCINVRHLFQDIFIKKIKNCKNCKKNEI